MFEETGAWSPASLTLTGREAPERLPAGRASASFFHVIGASRTSRLYSALTALFGVLAAALAIVGIYSVMSYTVAQRTRELAIRSALGASHHGLLSLVLHEGTSRRDAENAF